MQEDKNREWFRLQALLVLLLRCVVKCDSHIRHVDDSEQLDDELYV
jgi:hypothetical protein